MLSTYDLAFARKFADVAQVMVAQGIEDGEARRVVAYISRLSMELSLKAYLEQAGMPVEEIRKHWHNLRSLLAEIDRLEIEVEVTPGNSMWVSASRLRSKDIGFLGYSVTLGKILEAEDHGASTYPNEIRYGEMPRDFPPEALATAAEILGSWVADHPARRMSRDA